MTCRPGILKQPLDAYLSRHKKNCSRGAGSGLLALLQASTSAERHRPASPLGGLYGMLA